MKHDSKKNERNKTEGKKKKQKHKLLYSERRQLGETMASDKKRVNDRRPHSSNIFSETSGPIEAKFHMESP